MLDRWTAAIEEARRFRAVVLLVAFGALAIRVGYVLVFRDDYVPWGDAYFYHYAANLLADGEGFINPLQYLDYGVRMEAADHPPLYILYLAAVSLVAGDGTMPHLLASCLIGAATVVVTGYAAREVAGARIGVLAAILTAIYPNVWVWDGMLLSETVAIFSVSLLVLAVYRYLHGPSVRRAALMGLVVAVAAFSRSELLLLSVAAVTPAVLLARALDLRVRVRHLAAAGAACVLLLAPWVAYNLSRFEKPVYLSAGFEITLSTATCDAVYYGEYTGYWSMRCPLDILEARGMDTFNTDQSTRSEVLLDESLDYIKDNIDRVPQVVLARWGRALHLYHPIQQANLDVFPEGKTKWVAFTGLVSWYVLFPLAIAGAVVLRRRGTPIYPLLAAPAVVVFAVTVTFFTTRYRASAEGVLCILAAVSIDALLRAWRAVRTDVEDVAVADPPASGEVAAAAGDGVLSAR